MGTTDTKLEVRVPGSTSNLGPGFDLLGLAIDLELAVAAAPKSGSRSGLTDLSGEAAGWPTGADNLLLAAFDRVAGAGAHEAFEFRAHSQIPTGRGFGSSGAAVAAGLLLGASAAGTERDLEALFRVGLDLEGHPDNLGPSLFGGCQLLVSAGEDWIREPLALHESLRFAVAWPREPMPTRRARAALPEHPTRADAIHNAGRLQLLVRGLERGSPELLRAGCDDRLHVPHRLGLLPGAREALAAAFAAGAWSASLSGSGSGLFAIAGADEIEAVAAALRAELELATGWADARVVAAR